MESNSEKIKQFWNNNKCLLIYFVAAVIILLFIANLIAYSKTEDPDSVKIQPHSLFTIGINPPLDKEKTFDVVCKDVSIVKINAISFMISKITSRYDAVNLFNNAYSLYSDWQEKENISATSELVIPKGAFYIEYDFESLFKEHTSLLNFNFKTLNMAVYAWTRTYCKHLSKKEYTETNVVMKIGNGFIHISTTSKDKFFPEADQKVIIYEKS